MSRAMIFYQPKEMSDNTKPNSGTRIRPAEMKKAFCQLGYKIYEINGTIKERKKMVNEVLVNKEVADSIDFVYVESSNIPFALSNAKHFPFSLFGDISNFKKLHRYYKIGFFYRDIHWKQKDFYNGISRLKGIVLKALFRFEFPFLVHNIDILYVPSIELSRRFPRTRRMCRIEALPPGCRTVEERLFKKLSNKSLSLLYSGNLIINGQYDISDIIGVIESLKNGVDIDFYINSDSTDAISYYKETYPDDRLHYSSDSYGKLSLAKESVSIGIIGLVGELIDINMYMPIKLFYYLSLGLPVIAKRGTAYGNFVEENGVGWTYSDIEDLKLLLIDLAENYSKVLEIHDNILKLAHTFTWGQRAQTVEKHLSKCDEDINEQII